jgi:hypothetical protein
MRKLLILSAAVLLAGCGGGNSEDFSVDVAMTPGQAHTQLAGLDGGILLSALSLPKVTATQSDDTINFTLPGEKDDGQLILRLEEVGQNMTRVHVALDLPAAMRMIGGELMVVVEAKAEAELKSQLEGWAKGVSEGHGSLDQVNLVVGAFSLALRPGKIKEIEEAGDDGEQLARLINQDAINQMFEREGGATAADYASLDQPMDPGRAIADGSKPMDDAQGDTIEAFDPNPEAETAAY